MASKTASAELDPGLLARPRIAADVAVHEPAEPGAPWVIQRGSNRYFRVQADLARLVQAVDGSRDHAGLAATLGSPWTERDVHTAVRRLAAGGLLDDGSKLRRRNTWFRFVPPLTLQFTLMKPERPLARLIPVIKAVANRVGAVIAAVFGLGGLLALAFQSSAVVDALGRPLPPMVYLAVLAGVLATTVVHEMGHGAVLTYYGGRPSRMGVMLFYLTPAFFCDVSDGWRLPHRGQRVKVALAGVVTQWVIAGSAAVCALFLDAPLTTGLLIFAVVTYVSGLLNLLPFVKLDGYLALMSHLDIPHLRDRSMTDARRFLAKALFGGRFERELPQHSWAVPYGLVCLVFPLYLVGTALSLWGDALQGMGAFGASLVLCGISCLVFHLGRGGVRLAREARRAGARPWRIGAAALLVASAAAAVLGFVKVPYTINGSYALLGGGRAELVLPPSADRSLVREGAPVELFRAGVTMSKRTGSAAVQAPRATETLAPLSMLLPVRSDSFPMPVISYPLALRATPEDARGVARLDAGDRSLGEWLYGKHVAPAFRW
ncbi:daptide biosynthesis intramembrane metalloprotease [Streptomyces paromomycinus]|uniref:Peptide zinc metalloprotease protein n=1 Tax=Streptomyces paromomycinus TaxID=92743 RepID=A0A401W642_STREY|nr:daptide biosynthesis intramembrane metalloprotease [Streptomyces paromomycinus]GCD44725.1 hypothetical protein GKJPGBOP_04435 [Streptomyces paromomycinus]